MARKSIPVPEEGKGLQILYHTVPGRFLLKGVSAPFLSRICGKFMDTGLSRCLIPLFVKKAHIRLSDYEKQEFDSFNDCFTRKIRRSLRPVCRDPKALIAPCDGLLSVYPITGDTVIPVKQSRYTVSELLNDKRLAKVFSGGTCLVFRLCVNHYHRYCYLDDGVKGRNHFIPGRLHTVRPIALKAVPVFTENSREYTIMHTRNFGRVAQVEVGAMLVGKIKNHQQKATIVRGLEKGMFLYGGSTIVVLLQKGAAILPGYAYEATRRGEEIPVRMGEKIGSAAAPESGRA